MLEERIEIIELGFFSLILFVVNICAVLSVICVIIYLH